MNPDKFALYIFIGTYLTRAGSILLIVFGLRVLISFYKYNIRMAAFSESIASALKLVGIRNVAKFRDVAKIINPEKISFEKTPTMVPKEVLSILRVLSNLKNNDQTSSKKV